MTSPLNASPVFVFDFDSTLVRIETLEALAELSLAAAPDADERKAKIAELTDRAMGGEIGFGEALKARLDLLGLRKEHVEALADRILDEASTSIRRNVDFFERNAERIYILSGGFTEIIAPLAARLGLAPDHVLANELVYDEDGRVTGVNEANPLARENGKPTVIKSLNLEGPVVIVGDGWNDAEVKLAGAADRFYAFTEVVSRPKVTEVADAIAASLDEVLFAEGVSGRWSYPRNRIKMLLLENIHPAAVERLEEAGYTVETMKGALDEDDLIEAIKGVHVLGIRSKTTVTKRVLDHADRLMAVAAFCIGTNQIDLDACADKGVAVFNAPYSNTRSVVELALGMMIVMMRDVADKSRQMHQGIWNKSATGSREVRGKTLGIVGYGAIGSQLSILAENLGMRVLFYDLNERLALGNARRVRKLDDLLAEADVVTLHVDGRKDNANIFGRDQFAKMKDGALFLNLARGHIVDVNALADAVKSGRIAGAAVDVFPEEPRTNSDPFDSPLIGLEKVILTPHVGGSTEEAQEAIAEFAAERLLNYLNRGDTTFCVNLPNVQLSEVSRAHRLLHIHKNQPGVMAELNRGLSEAGLNILGQHLKTDERTGYVIIDVDREYDIEAVKRLRLIPGTVKFRMLH
ncbi:3-phosphoglycerate dehydrogenase [Brevundimonas sp. GN22]|uniref:phosphoglycerate dehydrogenase n=1 Tax=Brevundimonas pishanensis TaxID=2896315 RepID=UPI001FA7B297|nr:phosphoglycerate dehydrogenase [Brevundimonas pishanensis]